MHGCLLVGIRKGISFEETGVGYTELENFRVRCAGRRQDG